jgi:hypothetical protein
MKSTPAEKPKPKTRKKKLAGIPGEFLAPVPRNIEKFTDASGERFTRLIFDLPFTAPVTQSADRFFADAQKIPAMLTNPWVWLIIKPWLDNDPSEVDAFFKQFNTQEAAQERVRATQGTKSLKWREERALIPMVHVTRRILAQPDETTPAPGLSPLQMTFLCKLGEWVMNAVENDHEAPRRLYELLNDPTTADDKTNRSLINRDVFEAFARLVAHDRMLPTKKALRERSYIANDQNGLSTASRAYRELGLAGLPEG